MTIIITHPGSAHLDDFLSCCLVIHEAGDIERILRREPTPEEVNDPSIWKLDVGDKHDPEIKCHDHHQCIMDDCSLSLLLKDWNTWDDAVVVHKWLKVAVIKDSSGAKAVSKFLNISHTAIGALDSFIERSILELFQDREIIEKDSALFSLMSIIGQKFFTQIDEYFIALEEFEGKIEHMIINKVPIVACYKDVEYSSVLVRILGEKKREFFPEERGGIAIYSNNRPPGTIALSRYSNDRRVDFSRISKYEKCLFAHPQGFFASVEPMSEYELEQYIKGAIKGKNHAD